MYSHNETQECKVGRGTLPFFDIAEGGTTDPTLRYKYHHLDKGNECLDYTLCIVYIHIYLSTKLLLSLLHALSLLLDHKKKGNQSTGSSSSNNLKLKGSNIIPSPTKCLLIASTQCNLSECNMADVPSMTQRIAILRTKNIVNVMKIMMTRTAGFSCPKAPPRVMSQRTTESC